MMDIRLLIHTSKTVDITITPEIAQFFLTNKMVGQRTLSEAKAREYARAMVQRRWKENGETIKISSRGTLVDGQHRLRACVICGVPFISKIVFGVDESVYDTIDTGRPRNAAAALAHAGVANTTMVAPAVRWVAAIAARAARSNIPMDSSEVLSFVMENPDIVTSASMVAGKSNYLRPLAPAGLLVACHFLFSKRNKDLADAFFTSLGNGAGLAHGSPILTLRNRLLRARTTTSRDTPGDLAAWVINAWNAYRAGEQLTVLKGPASGEDGSPRLPAIN